jgi:hypothetical protein
MPEPQHRVATTRKVSLADFGDDLTDSYAIVTLADFEEVSRVAAIKFDEMTNLEATKQMLEVATKHFVSGKIATLNANGESELVDMRPEHIQASISMIGRLYQVVMGVIPDPKVTSTTTETSSIPSPSSEPSESANSTRTTSSTEPAPASPTQ